MNRGSLKGAVDQRVGRVKREAGEWGGDAQLQMEGLIQEVKGTLESAWSKAKDAVHEANEEAGAPHLDRS